MGNYDRDDYDREAAAVRQWQQELEGELLDRVMGQRQMTEEERLARDLWQSQWQQATRRRLDAEAALRALAAREAGLYASAIAHFQQPYPLTWIEDAVVVDETPLPWWKRVWQRLFN